MHTIDRTELVPTHGARLYTKRAGQGPALVLVSGGGGDADMYDDVVPLLAERHIVITFDRRGNSRSPLDASAAISVAEQADDIVAILDHLAIDRAYVFGNSGGAIITLDLLARHEDRLLGAVVHEPPLMSVVPGTPESEHMERLGRIGREQGPMRGFVAFASMTMPNPPRLFENTIGRNVTAAMLRTVLAVGSVARRVTGRAPGGMTRILGNAAITFRRELPEFVNYEPDITALKAVRVPWCLATGHDSAGRPYDLPAHTLSARLGVACLEFPGGHTVYQQQPEDFTRRLTEILDDTER